MNNDSLLKKALKHYEADDHQEAERLCRQLLDKEPTNTNALNLLGSIYYVQHNAEAALEVYLRLIQIKPDFNTHLLLGLISMALNDLSAAEYYLRKASKLDPSSHLAYTFLAAVYLKREDQENAIDCYRRAAKIDPHNQEIQYMLDSLTQSAREDRAPKTHIVHLFDAYAPSYDKHLIDVVRTRVPELMLNAVSDTLTSTDKIFVVDIGCGTGLVGSKFKNISKQLIGVDLSPQMIEAAKRKNIYDKLVTADFIDVLNNYTNIDLILCGDVLVYFGRLDEVFLKCCASLASDGLFVFTIEKTDIYPYELLKLARFAHSKKYVDELIDHFNCSIVHFEEAVLRKQKSDDVVGYLYVIKKHN